MATAAAKFRIDVAIHDLLMNSNDQGPVPAAPKGLTLPAAVFPQYPERLQDPGPLVAPEKRQWGAKDVYRYSRGWLFPYVRSRVMPGEFHPITAYLFVEYKCNLDCWYCWSYNNNVKGMTEDVARRSIDWLHDNGCWCWLSWVASLFFARISFTKSSITRPRRDSGFTSRPMGACFVLTSPIDSAMQACRSSILPWIPGISSLAFPRPLCPLRKIWNTSSASSTYIATWSSSISISAGITWTM